MEPLWSPEPFLQRFTGRFTDDDRTIVGRWEKAEDGTNYTTDFDLTYTRIALRGHRGDQPSFAADLGAEPSGALA